MFFTGLPVTRSISGAIAKIRGLPGGGAGRTRRSRRHQHAAPADYLVARAAILAGAFSIREPAHPRVRTATATCLLVIRSDTSSRSICAFSCLACSRRDIPSVGSPLEARTPRDGRGVHDTFGGGSRAARRRSSANARSRRRRRLRATRGTRRRPLRPPRNSRAAFDTPIPPGRDDRRLPRRPTRARRRTRRRRARRRSEGTAARGTRGRTRRTARRRCRSAADARRSRWMSNAPIRTTPLGARACDTTRARASPWTGGSRGASGAAPGRGAASRSRRSRCFDARGARESSASALAFSTRSTRPSTPRRRRGPTTEATTAPRGSTKPKPRMRSDRGRPSRGHRVCPPGAYPPHHHRPHHHHRRRPAKPPTPRVRRPPRAFPPSRARRRLRSDGGGERRRREGRRCSRG